MPSNPRADESPRIAVIGCQFAVRAQQAVSGAHGQEIVDLAIKHRLPVIGEIREWAEKGSLLAYGPKMDEVHRQAATDADKVLRGAKPGDLPIGQPTTFELVINLKAAKALGLTIPPSLLQRPAQVIE